MYSGRESGVYDPSSTVASVGSTAGPSPSRIGNARNLSLFAA